MIHCLPLRTLRFPDETDIEFRQRAERAGQYARILVDACLANECVQEYAEDSELPLFTIEDLQNHPIVRIEYEQAIAIGGIGETLRATKSKHWGDGPSILPLKKDDWFFPERITYIYRPNSLYNQRFEQRKRMKELLGKKHRPLVETAKRGTKKIFLEHLTDEQSKAIQRILDVEPGIFWRMAKGRAFHPLPPREIQLELPFAEIMLMKITEDHLDSHLQE